MTRAGALWRNAVVARRETWLAAVAYIALALLVVSPAHTTLSTRFIGAETGDVYSAARQVWWVKNALQAGDDVFFQSLLAHPQGASALGLWASPLAVLPAALLALVLSLAAAWNITLIATLAANGFAMRALARRQLGQSGQLPAFIAGAVYLALPAMQAQLIGGQIGALTQWTLPLLLICLYSYAERGGKRRGLRTALAFALAALASLSQLLYALLPMTALFVMARWLRRDQVGAARTLLAAVGGCLLLLVYLSPSLGEMLSLTARADAELVRNSIDLLDIATSSGTAFVGLLGGLLALLGVVGRRAARWWLLLAFGSWTLALGPLLQAGGEALAISIAGYETVAPLPYALFMDLPLVALAGQPQRFTLLYAVAVAMLAGFGADTLWRNPIVGRRHVWLRLILAAALTLLIIEECRPQPAMPSAPADVPQAFHDLASRGDVRAIYNAPYDSAWTRQQALWLQTAHGKPVFAGGVANPADPDPAKMDLLSSFEPSLLWSAGADIVILHKAPGLDAAELARAQEQARQQLGEPVYSDARRSVYETPFSRSTPPVLYATHTDDHAHTTYIYKAQPGWLELNATLEAVNRRVNLSLNGELLESLSVNGKIPLSLPLPIARRGYHSLVIALDPPCPSRVDDDLLVCHSVDVNVNDIRVLSSGAIYDPIRIEDGIMLAGYHLPDSAEEELAARFWWRFDAPRSTSDVRFVHLLDSAGRLVPGRQDDSSLGARAAGEELTETVRFDTRFLPAGEYRVLTGWYQLPDAVRYDVLTNVPGAQDDTILLGIARIEHPAAEPVIAAPTDRQILAEDSARQALSSDYADPAGGPGALTQADLGGRCAWQRDAHTGAWIANCQ